MVAAILQFTCPADAYADGGSEGKSLHPLDDGRRTLGKFPENLLRGFGGLFTEKNLHPFIVGATATALSTAVDDDVRESFADSEDDSADFAGEYLGPKGLGAITLGLFIGGRYSNDPRFRAMSYDLTVAVLVNLGYTGALKAAVGRERPDESDDYSFPSGHTSNAFAMASVMDEHYGARIGIPAYILASLIGISRVRADAHWLSDVVAGSALGYMVGRGVVHQNEKPIKRNKLSLQAVGLVPGPNQPFPGVVFGMVF